MNETNIEQLLRKRLEQLFALEMRYNGSDSYHGMGRWSDFNIHMTELRFDSDEVWGRKIRELTEEKERRNGR